MNTCDHDHQTPEEIRRLPIGGGAAVLVCYRHYQKEMAHRTERAKETGKDKWEWPTWGDLEIDQVGHLNLKWNG
jgi:hypothetical protein